MQHAARPQGSVDLVGALVATALAVALVAALVLEVSPRRTLAAVVVAIVPVLGLVALPVVRARSPAQDDDALRWFGAGLGVAAPSRVRLRRDDGGRRACRRDERRINGHSAVVDPTRPRGPPCRSGSRLATTASTTCSPPHRRTS